ncbi:hypothetical protein Fmac_012813 [Flemingia macrophylla]|uniref:EGF-like domain-containing protein n=1 Tax=Flemingia macrophylla TaxID=520843 RepID=A0ABD1MRC3_9FABA
MRGNDSSLLNNGSGIIHSATLNYDGIFRHYAHFINGSIQTVASWPKEENECLVKGYCGFNSYCTFIDAQPVCICLPGYDFIYPNDHTLGCKRIFQKEDCSKEKDSPTLYEMKLLPKILWKDSPYFKDRMSRDACSSACMADCRCEAATYKVETASCMKMRFPLRYLRRKTESVSFGNTTTWLLLKVGKSPKNRTGNDNHAPKQPPPIKTTSNRATVQIIVITSVFSFLLCSTLVISSHYMYKIRVLQYKRRNMELHVSEPEAIVLSNWAYKCFVRGQLNKLFFWEAVDKTLVENMLKVALWCVQDEPFLRQTMKSVVLMLEGVTDIAVPPCHNSNFE